MSVDSTPVQIYVTYRGSASDRFDREVYVSQHPADDADGTLAVCECRFRDEAAVGAAFSSEEAPEVMADVALFTDLTPNRFRAIPL
jgi:hypothetical protein